VTPEEPAIIVGVTITVVLLLFILVIVIFVRRHRQQMKKLSEQGMSKYSDQTPKILDNEYNRRLPNDYRDTDDLSEIDGQYSRTLPDFSQSASQDSTQYSRQLPDD